MAAPNKENQKRMDAEAARGVKVGQVYKVAADFGAGSQVVYTDAGVFVTRPGVPGAYFLPDALAVPPFASAPAKTGLVTAIDVASYQPRDLSAIIAQFRPQHVVVRLYLEMERPSPDHSRAQIASARANGCTAGCYIWLYQDADPIATTKEALKLARSCGVEPPVLWYDIETYTDGTLPSVATIRAALDACKAAGVRPGIYTGAWVIKGHLGGSTAFTDCPLWTADYKVAPSAAPPLDVPLYGGWTFASGHQFTSDPVDRSVFLASVCS